MNKNDIYKLLNNKKIWHEIVEHEAVYNMEDLKKTKLLYPEYDAKNLFLCDDKKNYFLITVKGIKKINLKEFKNKNNTSSLSFASQKDLNEILNLNPGSVSPFGLLNDKELKVKFFIDKSFMMDKYIIGVHPNDNTATVWLNVIDLIEIIKEHGNEINIVEI